MTDDPKADQAKADDPRGGRETDGTGAEVVDFPDAPPKPGRVLTMRQHKILQVIRDSVERRGYPPSVREIGQAAGLKSPSSVAHQLKVLEKRGLLRRDPNRPRAVDIRPLEERPGGGNQPAPTPTYVPVVGRIAAGGPILAEQAIEDVFPLPKDLVGEGTLFLLRVVGDSMIDAAITDGDWVVVRQQPVADNGDIVAAMIDGEATVKTFQRKDGHVVADAAQRRLRTDPRRRRGHSRPGRHGAAQDLISGGRSRPAVRASDRRGALDRGRGPRGGSTGGVKALRRIGGWARWVRRRGDLRRRRGLRRRWRRSRPAAVFAFSSSSCIALTSDLRMRSERPTPRAASGSFFAPKSRMNTARMIIQCHHDNPPMLMCLLDLTTVRRGEFSAVVVRPGLCPRSALAVLRCRSGHRLPAGRRKRHPHRTHHQVTRMECADRVRREHCERRSAGQPGRPASAGGGERSQHAGQVRVHPGVQPGAVGGVLLGPARCPRRAPGRPARPR